MDAYCCVTVLLGFVMMLTTICPSCAYVPSQLKDPSSFLSDSMLRDLLDQTIAKQYLINGGNAEAADEASYIDPLMMPVDEVSPRLAMLVRAANGELNAQPKRLQAEQLDYDSLLMSANARPSLRDQEYAHQSTLWGHHFVSGGHGEGVHLQSPSAGTYGPVGPFGGSGTDGDLAAEMSAQRQQQQQHGIDGGFDDGLVMNDQASATTAAAAAYRQSHLPQIKSDATLPAYCNPPNPCPVGYSAENGCQTEFENTAAYSREYQAAQECMCDNEHMFMCQQEPSNSRRMDYLNLPFAPPPSQQQQQLLSEAGDEVTALEHKSLVAKKFHPSNNSNSGRFNPYLEGEKLPVAAKKGIRSY